MMKIDGRDSAEYENWEKRDINVIFRKIFKSLDNKIINSASSPNIKRTRNLGR